MKGIDNTMKQTTQDTEAAAKAVAREERDSRNARVLACARGLVAGNSAFPALQIPSDGAGSADDLALVLCHHGHEDARLDATLKALAWTLAAKPAPRRVVLVEAQEADAGFLLEGLEGVGHVKRSIPEAGKGCWIKEALWTIGAREALKDEKVTKLCFLDADCSFADQGWAGEVSGALENHDLISPHSHMYYADQPDAAVLGLQPSSGHVIAAKEGGNGLPGLAVAMTRGFFLGRLGGQVPNLCIGSGDVYLWLVSAGKDRYPVNTVTFPHALTSAELQGMRPAPSIGTAGQIAVHRNHECGVSEFTMRLPLVVGERRLWRLNINTLESLYRPSPSEARAVCPANMDNTRKKTQSNKTTLFLRTVQTPFTPSPARRG